MTANKKCQTICIIVSTVTVVGIILFILQQYVMTMKTEDKGPITMKVINPTFNETSSDSSSHSWLMSGSAAGTYSNSRLRSRDDIDLESSSSSSTSSSLGINTSSDSNSGVGSRSRSSLSSNPITTATTNIPKLSDKQIINKQKRSWLYRQSPSDETHIVEGEYELCSGDVFGMSVNWIRMNKFCHHIIDNNMVNSFFEARNGVRFKHCRALEYKVNSESNNRPCWPSFYTSDETDDIWTEYIWSNTEVGDWIQEAIGLDEMPFVSNGLECYVRKALNLSKEDMKKWYDSQAGCGESLVGFIAQDS